MFGRSVGTRARAFACAALVGSLALTGCGGVTAPVPVSGTVTHKGKPVEGAVVTFSRGAGALNTGELASATTDASGRYELTTHFGPQSSGSGAVPGEYKVTVSKHVPPPGVTEAEYKALVDAATKAGESGAMVPANKQPPPLVEYFPRKYSAADATELKAKVEKGVGAINFTLD